MAVLLYRLHINIIISQKLVHS